MESNDRRPGSKRVFTSISTWDESFFYFCQIKLHLIHCCHSSDPWIHWRRLNLSVAAAALCRCRISCFSFLVELVSSRCRLKGLDFVQGDEPLYCTWLCCVCSFSSPYRLYVWVLWSHPGVSYMKLTLWANRQDLQADEEERTPWSTIHTMIHADERHRNVSTVSSPAAVCCLFKDLKCWNDIKLLRILRVCVYLSPDSVRSE